MIMRTVMERTSTDPNGVLCNPGRSPQTALPLTDAKYKIAMLCLKSYVPASLPTTTVAPKSNEKKACLRADRDRACPHFPINLSRFFFAFDIMHAALKFPIAMHVMESSKPTHSTLVIIKNSM